VAATVFPNTFLTIPGFFFLMFLFPPLYDGKLVPHIFLLPCPSFYITGTHEAFWHNLNTVRSWVSRFGAGSVIVELKALLYLIRTPVFGRSSGFTKRHSSHLSYLHNFPSNTQRKPIGYWACHVHIHALDILTPLEIVKRSIGTMNRSNLGGTWKDAHMQTSKSKLSVSPRQDILYCAFSMFLV